MRRGEKFGAVIRPLAWTFLAVAFFLLLSKTAMGEESLPKVDQSRYIGSEKCGECHDKQYRGWVKTFHSTVIQDARKHPEAILGDFSDPNLPFKKEDIWYTIGGHWDQRYLTKIGDDFYVLPRLWSVQSQKWRPYSTWAWRRRPYSKYCAGCHAVAYDPATKTYAEHTVGCEACHGPGKEHALDPREDNIVDPAKLPKDLADMICASCHVRGKDLTGQFYYPVGFVPGEDLAKYMVPLEKEENESVRESILRLWNKWKTDRETQARSRCQVCGIHTKKKPKLNGNDVNSFCMGCHEYEDRFADHTHHGPETGITCTDCHKQKPVEEDPEKEDVHSYSYFLVHPLNCWDKEIYKYCGKCHADKGTDWAFRKYTEWRFPVVVDH
ncbi:MAG: hypothetical protein D6713_07590 [Deltaproteobacteria bacterium]|nr:MAG: hypothetical protein D6713_07590 [Deltaproteobacteria bacterium]